MISPPSSILFSIGGFSFHYYGLIMFFAIIFAVFVINQIAKKYYQNVDMELFFDILPIIILSAVFGARVYYVLMDWSFYSKHLSEIIALWHGGMSIHGGILGGVISGLILAKIKKINFLNYADVFAYGLVLGQAVGRFGNYFNYEAFGKPCDIPFLKLFIPLTHRPFGYEDIAYYHPTFLYESLWDVFVFLILFFVIRRIFGIKDGTVFFSYLILYSIGRFLIESCRMDSVLNVFGLPVAQVASLFLIFVATVFLLIIHRKKGKI